MIAIAPEKVACLEKLTNSIWSAADLSHLKSVPIRLRSLNEREGWILFEIPAEFPLDAGTYRCQSLGVVDD